MAWTTWHNWSAGDTATEARMDQVALNVQALLPVGMIVYIGVAATTVETFLYGCWLELNGVSVLKADYPDLDTFYSGQGYPYGSDATHFTLPDALGRSLVSMSSGGHTDVNGLNDTDGLAKASRTPKAAAHTHTGPSHTHSFSDTATTGNASAAAIAGSAGGSATSTNHTHDVTVSGTTGSGGTGNTGSGGAYSGNFIVCGSYFVKAVN